MTGKISNVDPLLCPLCQQQNHCANLGAADTNKTCWCHDPDIRFPEGLLEKVAEDQKGKACICKRCAQTFSQTGSVSIFIPE